MYPFEVFLKFFSGAFNKKVRTCQRGNISVTYDILSEKNVSNDGLTFPVFSERWGIRTSLDDQFSHLKILDFSPKICATPQYSNPHLQSILQYMYQYLYMYIIFYSDYLYMCILYIYIYLFLSATLRPPCVFHGSRKP